MSSHVLHCKCKLFVSSHDLVSVVLYPLGQDADGKIIVYIIIHKLSFPTRVSQLLLGVAKMCKLSLKNVQRHLMYSINTAPLTIMHKRTRQLADYTFSGL